MRLDGQMTLADESPEYAAFVEKFKPKKTTDDCYTPENIYDVVADWVAEEYGADRDAFVRPFWPGADDALEAENAKLRELVRHLRECTRHNVCAACEYADDACDFDYDLRELGIEVGA